ncbi:MAG: binding domain protein [Lachnospiraceae bacterium]|jgi:predicted RNA-binding protein (virulence factor B family)|nr:binding domain protein [Lachnospiraceae bacterium]
MIKLGEVQTLEVQKTTDFGVYLCERGQSSGSSILLPKNQVPQGMQGGDEIEVFVYKDSEDRPIATTTIPELTLGKTAVLNVKEVTTIGAFLDWGLAKDLLLPFKEQTERVQTGKNVLVALYIDKSDRLCATMKVYDYLECNSPYKKDDRVNGVVYEIIDSFGAFVAVDNRYCALVPTKELHRILKVGEVIEARVIQVKSDGKLDLSIREKAHIQMDTDSELIYNKLKEASGFLPFHDKTDSEVIKAEFNLSKNAFKRAIGRLLKEGKITLSDEGINEVR